MASFADEMTMFNKMVRAEGYLEAINLEEAFVSTIAAKAVAVVGFRLKERRSTTVAAINNAQSLRVKGTSLNRWAKARTPDQPPNIAFSKISCAVENRVAERLSLDISQVSVQVILDSVNDISRLVFHFKEPVTKVPTH